MQPDSSLKASVERLMGEEYRKVKKLIEANKEAVIAIAEALILRNELTDIDVDEILKRVEATTPSQIPISRKKCDRSWALSHRRRCPTARTVGATVGATVSCRPRSPSQRSCQHLRSHPWSRLTHLPS